jgi:hypothetical protein
MKKEFDAIRSRRIVRGMNSTAYSSFTAIDGTRFAFSDYMSFATWFFSISRRVLVASFDAETFRALERAAANSREARRRMA